VSAEVSAACESCLMQLDQKAETLAYLLNKPHLALLYTCTAVAHLNCSSFWHCQAGNGRDQTF